MIKLLAKIPFFERQIFDYALGRNTWTKRRMLNLRCGFSFLMALNISSFPVTIEWLPVPRYEQMQVRLQEMESRIGREDLQAWLKLAKDETGTTK